MGYLKFYNFGKLIYKARWLILLLTLIAVIACIPIVPKVFTRLNSTGFQDPFSQSAQAETFVKKNLNYQRNQFIIMYQGKRSFTNNTQYFSAIRESLSALNDLSAPHVIIYPDSNKEQISADKRSAYVVFVLKSNEPLSEQTIQQIKSKLKRPAHLTMLIDGEPVFLSDTNLQTQRDLLRAEYIATPLAIITLLLVFGSVTAAIVPIILDGICAVFILSILACISTRFSLSVFTLNIAMLLGLCLSLDYALFIIYRFREELTLGRNIDKALAITQATAGKAVFFSGLAVFASLSALLFFPVNILFSIGVGGITAVGVAMFVSLIILPAFLAVLKDKINFLPIGLKSLRTENIWLWIVGRVVRYPWTNFISILVLLLFLGSPLLAVNIGISDYRILPDSFPSRQVFNIFEIKFSKNQLLPIYVLIKSKQSQILTETNISTIYNLVDKLKSNPDIKRIDSIVSTDPRLTKKQYEFLYTHTDQLNPALKQLLKITTHNNSTLLTIISKYPSDSPQTKNIIDYIRKLQLRNSLSIEVTGQPANTFDVLHKIAQIFPLAFIWVIVLSYFILLLLLRSLFLPIKAILTNMLSLFASYGILVFIIQKGHFAALLHFPPQGMIDISLLIIIFCALFGFSMDYEVFLLSRIKEDYEQMGNNVASICHGIAHSSKIITSAAIVVILICFSFISAEIILVKAFGLGIAIAIFIDAFLIRTILVPAVMTLLGKWNWYLPKWLDRILPNLAFKTKDD